VNLVYRLIHGTARAVHKLYSRWQVIGHDKIPKSGPVIVVCNHVSYVDPTILGAAIKRECAFIARSELWNNKFLAWILPRLGTFPIHKDRVDREAIEKGLNALKKGLVLVIFPEGTRSEDGNLIRAEAGAALFVQKSGAPVVPAALIGPEVMLPVGADKLKRARVKCIFGDPIQFAPKTPREEIIRTMMRAIAALLTEHGRPMRAREDIDAEAEAEVKTAEAAKD
jgi:1-acyl-sn-glycerol-3-phosphate acyltransferase